MADFSRRIGEIWNDEPELDASLATNQGNPILGHLGGAARGLAGFLEPIQLPQDALFATVAGAFDPDTTIAGRLRTMRLGDYLPWGEAPDRPATGREIFELAGLKGNAAKWAGIGADLFADPLLFGSYLRIGGKLMKSDNLLNLGDKFDDMLSPMGLSRAVKGGIAKAAPEFSALIDKRVEEMIDIVRNPESTFLGIQGAGRIAQNIVDRVAPRGKQLQLKFGKEVGGELAQVERMAKVAGFRIGDEHLNLLAEAQSGIFGQRGEDFVKGYINILGRYRPTHEKHFTSVPQLLRDATERATYDVVTEQGLLFSNVAEEAAEAGARVSTPAVVDLFNEVRRASFGDKIPEAPDRIRELVLGGRAKVKNAALEMGEDADVAVQRFNDYLQDITEIDALLGKHISGFDFIKSVAFERVQKITGSMGEATSFWDGILAAGVAGRFDAHLQSATKWKPADRIKASPERIEAVKVRREAYKQQLFEEMELSGLGDNLDIGAMNRRMVELEESAGELYRRSAELRPSFQRVPEWEAYEGALDSYGSAVGKARAVADEMRGLLATPEGRQAAQRRIAAQRGRDEAGRIAPGAKAQGRDAKGKFASPQGTSRWDVLQDKLRQNIATRLEAAKRIEKAMDDVLNSAQARSAPRRAVDNQLMVALREMDSLRRDFNTERFRFSVSPEDAAKARAKAAEKAGNTPLPALEKDLSIEELIVERLSRGSTFDKAMNDPFTVEEIIGSAQAFSHLDLGAFLFGLGDGHLRRAYGLFQDRGGFNRYLSGVRDGRLFMNNVLDDTDLKQAMPGFEQEADLIRQYQRNVASGGKAVIAQGALVQHLIDSGVGAGRARDSMTALIKSLHADNPAMMRQIETLEEMVPKYEAFFDANMRSGSKSFFGPREPDIPKPILETLGEFSRASISIGESAEGVKRAMPKQQFFQNTWKLATAKGLARNEKHIDEFGTRYVRVDDTGGMFKAFSGKYVHPQLLREMERALKHEDSYSGWQRIRALITGGYLSSPNVLAANFFGGFYQAATHGIGPQRMIPRVAKVWERVRRVQDGHQDEVIERLRARIPIEISSLSYHAFQKDFQKLRLDAAGLGPTGLRKALGQMEEAYMGFLNRPGIGPLRTRYAGLDGFQMIENVFKVAAFEEMLEELPKRWARKGIEYTDEMVEKHAAEFARTVVFDYSELPSSLEALKNTGLVLFPGFSYFLAGRTLDTYWRRPGVLGVSDRMSEAVSNMSLDENERLALWLGMPDWLKEDQGAPIAIREGKAGDKRASVIPMAQLIPTQTIWDAPMGQGNPWAESITNLGLWGPWAEVAMAIVRGEGEAFISARYGNRVFDDDAKGGTKAAQMGRFLYNTHAPGVVKKLIRPSYNEGADGLLPELAEFALPQGMTDTMLSFDEQRRGRPERHFKDEVISVMLRSPQPIAIDGDIPGIASELRTARSELTAELSSLRTKYGRAEANGNQRRMAMLAKQMTERSERFDEIWNTYLEVYKRGSAR